jgi:hypothetical protein
MFDITQVKKNVEYCMENELDGILKSSGINLDHDMLDSIGGFILSYIDPKRPKDNIFYKPPPNQGVIWHLSLRFDTLPPVADFDYHKDVLVVRCLGSDNLYNTLVETIIHVEKHPYPIVIFFTSKWDMATITGKNIQRFNDLFEQQYEKGTKYCFILLSTWGICKIPVFSQ